MIKIGQRYLYPKYLFNGGEYGEVLAEIFYITKDRNIIMRIIYSNHPNVLSSGAFCPRQMHFPNEIGNWILLKNQDIISNV